APAKKHLQRLMVRAKSLDTPMPFRSSLKKPSANCCSIDSLNLLNICPSTKHLDNRPVASDRGLSKTFKLSRLIAEALHKNPDFHGSKKMLQALAASFEIGPE